MARKTEFEKFLDDIKGKHSKRANAIMLTIGEEDEAAFLVNYFKALEYASPKLQRSEIVEDAVEQVITIEHTYIEKKEEE